MSDDHAYTVASFGANKIDVEWIQHLIVIESPALVADASEVEVHMRPMSNPNDVLCQFVPTLTSPAQTDQLDAIMSGYTGRPSTAPNKGYWQDEDDALYTTTSVYSSFHTCMDNTIILDPGTYTVRFEVVCSVSAPGNGMRSKFTIDGATVGNIDYHEDQHDNHKSFYGREHELVVVDRADYQLKIEFCKDSSWSGSAEIRDQKMVVRRIKI